MKIPGLVISLLGLLLLAGWSEGSSDELPSLGSEWQKTFGGTEDDEGYSVQQTTDGGYIIAGYTDSYSVPWDVYLIKTNASGREEWQKTIGGELLDYGYSVQQTADGGYIIAGYTYSYGAGESDVYLVKTDDSGNVKWQKTFGGEWVDEGRSVQQTADGGYIIAGYTGSHDARSARNFDVYLIKTDGAGNAEWQKTFGATSNDEGYSVQQTTDSGYIIAGYTDSYGAGESDVYLVKTDAAGNEEWQKTFGGESWDKGYSVQQTTDGGYIVAGYIFSSAPGWDEVYLVKTDAAGNEEWQKTFGGTHDDEGHSVQQTTDGGYIVAGIKGHTDSFIPGYSDVYLIKTDAAGNAEWQKTFGGDENDVGYSVQQTTDGGYIIAGNTRFSGARYFDDVYLIKTDADGNIE